jgi:hypothetical protein
MKYSVKMNRIFIRYVTILLLSICITVNLIAQDTRPEKPSKIEMSTEDLPPIKYAFGNVGYGPYYLWAAAGFRWWYFGISFGLSGFNKSLPAFRSDSILQPRYIDHTEDFIKLIMHGEASFYYDVNPYLSLFASIGFYSQNDSVLARSIDYQDPYLYRHTDKTEGGLCFGLGGHYFLENQIGIGIGYQTKNGFYIQLGYYWE